MRRKRQKRLAFYAGLILIMALIGCSGRKDKKISQELPDFITENGWEKVATEPSKVRKVGVAMPTRVSERWISDGTNMKAKLEALGYEVNLDYADNNIELQIEQIKNMILDGVECLVISSIDSEALVDVLEMAQKRGIYVIAYDRLLMKTDAVSYYATFDNKLIGRQIGEYIEEKKELKTAARDHKSYTIEFFMGSPDDNNALYLYDGMMEVLKPYLDNGVLVCRSGKISFEETCILRWLTETAEKMCEEYLVEYYAEEPLDIVCSAFDGFCYGAKTALLRNGYELGTDWPLITGQDADLAAMKNIISGYQAMTIFKDTRLLATKCVTMVQAVLENAEPEINDTNQYDNGILVVPSYLCTPEILDVDNYEKMVVEGGYYTEVQLME